MFRIIAGILVAFILSIAVLIYFGLYAVFRAVLYNTNERKSGHVPLPTGEGYDQHQESMQELVDLMKEIPYEEVSVRSFDNLTLYGRYYEVKKVYQNISTTWSDEKAGVLDVFNKNYYTDDLSDYELCYQLTADGKVVKEGTADIGTVAPRSHGKVRISGLNDGLGTGKDYLLHLTYRLKHDMPWAKAGYVQAEEQLSLQTAQNRPLLASQGKVSAGKAKDGKLTVNGKTFTATFDLTQGTLYHLDYGNNTVIADGCGPRLNAFRAWTNNDN